MEVFRRIVKKKPRTPPKQDDDDAEPSAAAHPLDILPSLPATRRPVTPDPVTTRRPPQPIPPFFTLPYELRHEIYLLVLGHRTIHLDMRYTAASTAPGHPHTTAGAFFFAHRRWRWRAHTCHRDPGAQAAHDRCGAGGPPPTNCAAHPHTPCAIGPETLGLLLACRATYREAASVLYGPANTFHVSSGALLLRTPALLAPPRAAQLARLVLALTHESVAQFAAAHLGLVPGWPAFVALLAAVPKALPGLRSLQVLGLAAPGTALAWRAGEGEFAELDGEGELARAFLGPVDALVRAFAGQLRECVFVLESYVFDAFLEGDLAEAERTEDGVGWVQFWRPVQGVVGAPDAGYWIRRVMACAEAWYTLTYVPPE
ncbi:hypothetical protein B0T24DRAFT_205264 [Lasiosphaeria ovina]|uniref:DUF7730 domain-containing protein n=1 Tax=Lasiosphaeria ovina TaxID=92902 RepID=A0AAE0KGG3_9PEZI|nr:hypothetical protein B0T24DRAFT_205264 [Lasiosphaeria ovina]